MSLSHIIDTGVCPPPWTAVRAHRIHSCTDLQFDRDLIGEIRLNGNIPPGAHRTFLHTDNVGVINWKTFNKDDIPAGADGDYLQTIGTQVEWAPPSFSPSTITPGLPDQIFHTDSTGAVAEWSSNIVVPGTFRVNSSTTLDGNVDCNSVLNVDGNFFSNANSSLYGTTDIQGDLQFASNSGSVGQVLTKTGASTQDWQNLSVPASGVAPGTANQVFVTDGTGTTSQWSSNLALPGTLGVTGGSTLSGVTNVTGNLQLNGVSGSVGQYLKKTGAATQAFTNILSLDITPGINGQALMTRVGNTFWSNILISDITPGLANQIAVTDPTGTFVTWTFTPTVTNLNILNNLQFNSVSGTTGQFIKKTGASTQAFANIVAGDITPGAANAVLTTVGGVSIWQLPTTINVIKYGTTFAAQNLNAAAGPTALSFSTSPYIASAISTVGTPTGISQPSATQFTIGTLGTYNVDITGFIDPTSTGLGNSIVALSLEINGVEQSASAIVCNGNYSFSGRFSGVLFTAGATIRILARRVAGVLALNTFAAGTGIPSFSSTICFST